MGIGTVAQAYGNSGSSAMGGLFGIVLLIIVSIDMAKVLGKGTGFGVGLALLPFIFYAILFYAIQAFGPALYDPSPLAR